MFEKIFGNKITKTSQKVLSNSSLPFEFMNFEKLYQDYVKAISKGGFANAPTRYLTEVQYLDNIFLLAKKYNLDEQISAYTNKKGEVLEKLKSMGITFK